MLLLMGGLIFWKMKGGDDAPAAPNPPPVVSAAPAAPLLEEPPPPPPPPAEETAVAPTEDAPKSTKKPTGGGGCDGECKGTATAALTSALRGKAGQARGCYERALRQNATLEGRLVLNVRVGPRGQVCSATVGSSDLADPTVAQCVQQMFRAASLPAPTGGCVNTAVPMYFKPRS